MLNVCVLVIEVVEIDFCVRRLVASPMTFRILLS